MTLLCAVCLGLHEAVEAVTVADGAAMCARHVAVVIAKANPAINLDYAVRMVDQTLRNPRRHDTFGDPVTDGP